MSNKYAYIGHRRDGYITGAGDGFGEGKALADQLLAEIEVAAKNNNIDTESLIERIQEARAVASFALRTGRKL